MNFNSLIPFELCNIGKPFHIWFWCMKITLEHILCNLFVLLATLACLAGKPCVIGRTRYMKVGTSKLYRIAILLVALLNTVVLPCLPHLPKVSLLSISFSFFNRWFSISAICNWGSNCAIRICAFSNSVRGSCSCLRLPRRSSSPDSPSPLYFSVHVRACWYTSWQLLRSYSRMLGTLLQPEYVPLL